MKILILVLSYNDGKTYSDFYNAQLSTWDSIIVDGVETYYYFGNHDKNEIIDNNILVNVEEKNINICSHKTLKAFELIKDLEFDYLFRTNSSSYIDKQKLLEFIEDKPTEKYYSGRLGSHDNIIFASGSGFFISKDVFQLLLEKSDSWEHSYIDDVLVGKLLKEFNISPHDNSRYDVHSRDIPMDYFHYRLKTNDRKLDVENMYIIHKKKTYDKDSDSNQ